MKRFLSLFLVAIMLLSTLMLTSCDPIGSVKGFVNKILGREADEGVRTTITLEEWIAAGNNTNFTIVMQEGGVEIEGLISDNAAKIRYYLDEEIQQTVFFGFETGCLIRESSVGWLGYAGLELVNPKEYGLAHVVDLTEETFEELYYNEEEKCYSTETYGTIVKYYFENGKLVHVLSMPSDPNDKYFGGAEIKNIGTTVVELPEHTVINDGKADPSDADASVRTTISNEELLKHLDMTNFTVNIGTVNYGYSVDVFIKIAENGLELTASMYGEIMSQYMTVIDGILYSIEPHGDGHLATSMGVTVEEALAEIGPIEEYLNVDNLVYNEAGRYYTLEIEGESICFYFENGQLVKAVYISNSSSIGSIGGAGSTAPNAPAPYAMEEYMEIIFVISDIGTTKVEIPEFTK